MSARWPHITADLEGIGGEIKADPAHFVVEEIPLYEPAGGGEHVYVRITREGWNTRDLQKALATLFGLRPAAVGAAGLKDKHARVTQTFSITLPDVSISTDGVARKIEEALPVKVIWAMRHRNKLRKGHLLGNRFRIVVRHPDPEGALPQARVIAEALREQGLPNYYGGQRFGHGGGNIERGREILMGTRRERDRWLKRFLLSACQAHLFNEWLAERIQRGWFTEILEGDIAKVIETGGIFEVEDVDAERARFERREITYTGPIYGEKMRWAQGVPGELERSILEHEGISEEVLHSAKLPGSRRPARLFLKDLDIEVCPEGLRFSFELPKGAYATTVLREFLKGEP
jgi:tRNA pseudouridine13 synthase